VLNANPHPNIKKRLSAANKRNSYRFSVDRSGGGYGNEEVKGSDMIGSASEIHTRGAPSRVVHALTSGLKTINDDQIDYSAQERELDIADEIAMFESPSSPMRFHCPNCNTQVLPPISIFKEGYLVTHFVGQDYLTQHMETECCARNAEIHAGRGGSA
jgi:hypothetical protein